MVPFGRRSLFATYLGSCPPFLTLIVILPPGFLSPPGLGVPKERLPAPYFSTLLRRAVFGVAAQPRRPAAKSACRRCGARSSGEPPAVWNCFATRAAKHSANKFLRSGAPVCVSRSCPAMAASANSFHWRQPKSVPQIWPTSRSDPDLGRKTHARCSERRGPRRPPACSLVDQS